MAIWRTRQGPRGGSAGLSVRQAALPDQRVAPSLPMARAPAIGLVGAVAVLGLKWVAYELTGSIALYSDALESLVNVTAAVALIAAVRVSRRPPDHDHPYGHGKVEYFSAIFEGTLIAVASAVIFIEAWDRLRHPTALARLDVGLAVSLGATVLNGALATYLLTEARHLRSPALRADGLHLWTDVATSVGVFAGTGLAGLTGVWVLDPVIAIIVAANVLRTGGSIVRESVAGLMDESLSPLDIERIRRAIAAEIDGSMTFHALRSRRAGTRRFVDFHLVVPSTMSVRAAHEVCDRLEVRIAAALPGSHVTIHVEPDDAPDRGDAGCALD